MKTQNQEEQPEKNDAVEVKEKQKVAFFITPLGSDTSDIRRHTNGIIDAVLRPLLKNHGISLVSPHEIENPGNITKQVIKHILSADLVIANLTGLNPNVMYEVAVRHAKRKPIIVIAENGTTLPFDLAAERTFFYHNDMAGVVKLTDQLNTIIPKALLDEKPDNPIYSGIEAIIIQEIAKGEGNPIDSYIVDKLGKIDDMYTLMKNVVRNQQGNEMESSDDSLDIKTSIVQLSNGHILQVNDRVQHRSFGGGFLREITLHYKPNNPSNNYNTVSLTIDFDISGYKVLPSNVHGMLITPEMKEGEAIL